jgi:hypothetical protein
MGVRDFWQEVRRNPVTALAGIAVVVVSLAIGFVFVHYNAEIAAAVASVGSLLGVLVGAAQVARTWHDKVVGVGQRMAEEVRKAQGVLDEERKSRVQAALASSPQGAEVRRLEREYRALDSEIGRLRQGIGITADYVSLADLVSARLKRADYEGELGLMHRVQRDLRELSDALTLQEGHPNLAQLKEHFPRGPARIVLFVDDLDRCPPDRVVEVLEATQLLVKTSLFVVVLALDVRFVTRALEKVYKGILTRRGNPSGLDYVEKIIQLPYSVRPVDRTSLDRFLSGQMEVETDSSAPAAAADKKPVQDGAPGPSGAAGSSGADLDKEKITVAVLRFTRDELSWFRKCCELTPLTPRAIKRIVNAFKLLKIIWHRPNRHYLPTSDVKHAFLALLYLSAKYPQAMRHLFDRVSKSLDEGTEVDLHAELLRGGESLSGQILPAELEGFKSNLSLIPQQARLRPELRPTFELVRSLSFVAEIGYNPREDGPSKPESRGSSRLVKRRSQVEEKRKRS